MSPFLNGFLILKNLGFLFAGIGKIGAMLFLMALVEEIGTLLKWDLHLLI